MTDLAALQWTQGDRLRKAREVAGLNHDDLAEALGVSSGSISRYEHDKLPMRRSYLLAWAMRCGVPLSWLQTGEDTPDDQGERAWSCIPAACLEPVAA